MRLVLGLVLAMMVAGCATPAANDGLDVYHFRYAGSNVAVDGVPHGWLFTIQNPTDHSEWAFVPEGIERMDIALGGAEPVAYTFDAGTTLPHGFTLEPGQSTVVLVNLLGESGTVGYRFAKVVDGFVDEGPATEVEIAVSEGPSVGPGDHVQTVTVGVWLNGTSFYTNSADLLEDPAFPAGGHIDRAEALQGTDPLPIYVFDAARTEQPAGSKDTCHFTTIDGYNDLLKFQAEGSTGVRLLDPEEAYTRSGAEEHLLYGDSLVFLNTIVAHDGATGPQDVLPQPQGACFAPDNSVPAPPAPPI